MPPRASRPAAPLCGQFHGRIRFDQVTAAHAFAEGEDDRTLPSWRRIHRDFYEKFIAPGVEFRDDISIICQRFRVLYPPAPSEV